MNRLHRRHPFEHLVDCLETYRRRTIVRLYKNRQHDRIEDGLGITFQECVVFS